jgi:hypothetical protein
MLSTDSYGIASEERESHEAGGEERGMRQEHPKEACGRSRGERGAQKRESRGERHEAGA